MSLRFVLSALVVTGALAFSVTHIIRAEHKPPRLSPPSEPAWSPTPGSLSGTGMVEARSENIAIGTPVGGVVVAVCVKVGQEVRAGTPLFRLDDRELRAEVKVRQTNLAVARAELGRWQALPRPEDLPPSAARVREAEVCMALEEDLLERRRRLNARNAVSGEDLIRADHTCRLAREQLARARAEDALLRAGAWQPNLELARVRVEQAQALLERAQAELDRLEVRAPKAGTVLRVNVREGECVAVMPGRAAVVLGDLSHLHVRVELNEYDVSRFQPGATAWAVPRGQSQVRLRLRFSHLEPMLMPKRSLSGDAQERVDTRVLQVIYALSPEPQPVYVGQQVDVFVEVPAQGRQAASPPTQGQTARPGPHTKPAL